MQSPPITFINEDLRGLLLPHNDALIISSTVANFNIQRILIDNGSYINILASNKMKIGQDWLHLFNTPLVGFGEGSIQPLGWVKLAMTLGWSHTKLRCAKILLSWTVLSFTTESWVAPTFGKIKAITSTYLIMMKFPTSTEIAEVRGYQKVSR